MLPPRTSSLSKRALGRAIAQQEELQEQITAGIQAMLDTNLARQEELQTRVREATDILGESAEYTVQQLTAIGRGGQAAIEVVDQTTLALTQGSTAWRAFGDHAAIATRVVVGSANAATAAIREMVSAIGASDLPVPSTSARLHLRWSEPMR